MNFKPYLFLCAVLPHYEVLSKENDKKCEAFLHWSTCLTLSFDTLDRIDSPPSGTIN